GGAHMALDIVGQAQSPDATLAALHALRRNGRLGLMGSMNVPMPVSYMHLLTNNLEIVGQFMHTKDAFARLLDLVRSGQLDLTRIAPRTFPLAALSDAMAAAEAAGKFEIVVVKP